MDWARTRQTLETGRACLVAQSDGRMIVYDVLPLIVQLLDFRLFHVPTEVLVDTQLC